jgi:hypothetical protein
MTEINSKITFWRMIFIYIFMDIPLACAKLGIGQPAVSILVARGEVIVREKGLGLPRRQGK